MKIKAYWSIVAELGCCVSGGPATIHHIHGREVSALFGMKGWARKSNDWLVIPLAEPYHTGRYGIDRIGVETWERQFGSQLMHLRKTIERAGVDVFKESGLPCPW